MPRGKVTQVKVVGRITPLLVGLAQVMSLFSGCSGALRASHEETAEGRSTSFVRLGLSPTNNSGVGGSATFARAAAGTRIELELRGLPEPHEIYLAHLHSGSCEDEEHPDAQEGETADHHGHENSHEEHADAHVQGEDDEATAAGIEYPLTPVESNAGSGCGPSPRSVCVSTMLAASKGRGRYGDQLLRSAGSPTARSLVHWGDLDEVCGAEVSLWQGRPLDRQRPLGPPLRYRWREEPISHPSHTLDYEPFKNAMRRAPWLNGLHSGCSN